MASSEALRVYAAEDALDGGHPSVVDALKASTPESTLGQVSDLIKNRE